MCPLGVRDWDGKVVHASVASWRWGRALLLHKFSPGGRKIFAGGVSHWLSEKEYVASPEGDTNTFRAVICAALRAKPVGML